MRITGLRPTRSDSDPSTGANTNCVSAYVDARTPNQRPAIVVLPPANSLISSGRMGMMIPIPSTSMKTVMRMKIIAALRPCPRAITPTLTRGNRAAERQSRSRSA